MATSSTRTPRPSAPLLAAPEPGDPAPIRVRELALHSHPVRFAEAGADSGGPTVVLLHGIASRSAEWAAVMGRLGRTAHVIAPDLLGHGESAKPRGDYSLGAHACTVRDLCQELGLGPVTLLGHSLGGGISMQFAYQFPERVEGLILVSSGGLGTEVSGWLRAATLPGAELVLPLIAGRWVRGGGRQAQRLLDRVGVPVPVGLSEALRGFASLGDADTRQAFLHTARSVIDPRGQRVDARTRLHQAPAFPLLVVWGAKDAIIPVAHGRELAAALPHAQLEVFDQSGHFPHLTEPGRLADLVLRWLADHPHATLPA